MKNCMLNYTRTFDDKYEYTGSDLGVNCALDGTQFKLWAPTATAVELCLYSDGGTAMELPTHSIPEEGCTRYPLTKGEKGVWSIHFPVNMHGRYYDYLLHFGDETVRTADPYAKACSCNGCRSMVIDLKTTNPAGFIQDMAPLQSTENIIYELHIKDFSYDPKSGIPEEYRGKYKAFTVQTAGETYPTGIEYLRELGVTHVHLLPFFDYGWLNEAGEDNQFNWGYDPLNYNVPEGSYATDTQDGTVRIRECKEMIQALHKAGIRVIMDVVYNHTHEADSWLERTVPGYFAKRDADSVLTNGSACGNDMAVGRAMVDNYILNSCLYWAEEYHIDGFRFDLMGLMTTELMNRIRQEMDRCFGVGEKLLYGEPWRAAQSPMEQGTHPALKENIEYLDSNIAVFCDVTRDAVKGDVFFPRVPGFVNGGKDLEDKILDAVNGWRDNVDGFCPKSCNQVINYVSAHDNFTLWDKLLFTMKDEKERETKGFYDIPYDDVLAANKLAALIYFTCQGHLFFQAGEEFGRTKYGDENSFRSKPEVNMIRWEQTEKFGQLISYYQGLIRLRKQLPGLYDKSIGAAERISGQTIHREGVVSFLVDNTSPEGNSAWEDLLVVYNASDVAEDVNLPGGRWQILADEKQTDCRKNASDRVSVEAKGGMILGKLA